MKSKAPGGGATARNSGGSPGRITGRVATAPHIKSSALVSAPKAPARPMPRGGQGNTNSGPQRPGGSRSSNGPVHARPVRNAHPVQPGEPPATLAPSGNKWNP